MARLDQNNEDVGLGLKMQVQAGNYQSGEK
jgi:hypothetical protein